MALFHHQPLNSPKFDAQEEESSGSAHIPTWEMEEAPLLEMEPLPPEYIMVRRLVQKRLINQRFSVDAKNPEASRQAITPIFNAVLHEKHIAMNSIERERLFDMVMADILGLGPIQPLLDDPDISEVMVNGPQKIYVEKKGNLHRTNVQFEDDDHVMKIIERIVAPLGRRVDESSPLVDARLPDGSRVNIIIPPLSLVGPCITIRKFSKEPLTVDDLIQLGSFTSEFAEFVKACVVGRLNTIISGGTGSGKTTLLNVLSGFIPHNERIITIEDAAELQLRQEHVVRLESRPPNIEGKGAIRIRDLVINSLRMRPDRIIIGECRGPEALDMLQAMNTGHDGSLTTAHSNGPRDTLSRLETMVLMAGMDLPLRAVRQQIASAMDLIIHTSRIRDGSRKVVAVTEITGMEGDTILTQDIFLFEEDRVEDGKIIGELRPTGIRPAILKKLAMYDVKVPPSVFGMKF